MTLTKKQALVYRLLADVAAKFILALIVGGVFIAITVKLLVDPDWPIAAAESFIGFVTFRVFKHYFPSTD